MEHEDPTGMDASAVAVIGMSGRFPGARNVAAFWQNLRDGRETIRFFSDEELLAAGERPELLRDPAYVKACGYLDGIDQFDAAFFGMSPRDAAIFDPQHRIFLECSWEAFEDAGYVAAKIGGPVGVFAASGASEYFTYNLSTHQELLREIGAWLLRHTGNDSNFLATRVSYELDLDGPSMSVQTACSSSLVAVHLACQSLLNGECDVALAGASTIYPEQHGYVYRPGEILSPDGHCRPFDAGANGTVMASAAGCVVLKRLSDAMRDGDQIRAVIRASAINNDGSDKVGYLAPSVGGQVRVISEALNLAGITSSDISYVEAHGTGTLMGDPIEIAALVQAFGPKVARQSCAIGSLKSNFGHAGEAAGICGLIKTVCALQHRELPATLHYQTPNEQADLANSPFFVNTSLRPWNVSAGKRRIAGVTALGAGGTNAHIVLEEAPPRPSPVEREIGPQLLVLSARGMPALNDASRNLAGHLLAHPGQPLDDVAFTLMAGREPFEFRRSLVATSGTAAARLLEAEDPSRVFTGKANRKPATLAFLFPGGGAQYARMGADLYEREPAYRQAIDACLAIVQPELGVDLRALMFPEPREAERANVRLEAPSLALPALFATEYAMAELLESWGIVPTALIGHSAGEYAAACVSGVLTMRDAISLVAMRGKLFEKLPSGAMLSVALSEAKVRPLLGRDLSLAAVNGPSLCVASGPTAAIASLEKHLAAQQVEHARVHIDVAAHSAMLDPIQSEFERFCRSIPFKPPRIPLVSNLTGTWIRDDEATDPTYWVRHLRHTVRFDEGARTLVESGNCALLEVGPGRTLSSLCRQQPVKAAAVANTLRHPQEAVSDVAFVMEAVGKLWVAGIDIDPRKFKPGSQLRVPLPTYPFERQRYWIDKSAPPAPSATLARKPDLEQWFSAPAFRRSPPSGPLPAEELRKPWLVFSDGSSLAESLIGRLRASGARVATVEPAARFGARGALTFAIDPSSAADYATLVAALRDERAMPAHVVHLWALASRPRRFLGATPDDDLAAWGQGVVRYYYSLLHLAQALAFEVDSLRLTAIGTAIEALDGERLMHPEKATLAGICRVLPREMPGATCSVVDVTVPAVGTDAEARLVDRLLAEVYASDRASRVVVLRAGGRWSQCIEHLPLAPAGGARPWLRQGGVYLVTGGLGGIGLEVMEHLARHGKARLVAVGRSAMPEEKTWDWWLENHGDEDDTSRKIRKIRALHAIGAEVMLVTADVTDRYAMRSVVSDVRRRFGQINGVFHCAGLLKDQLIALRDPVSHSPVLDVKAKGGLVLQTLFADGELDFLVLFSSVSSILGLAGQADYTAANAFLDALAKACTARGSRTRTISIGWNAWKDVGMLATRVREQPQAAARRKPTGLLLTAGGAREDAGQTVVQTAMSPNTHWMLGEHVVRGGQAVMPGTGYLELARAALARRPEDRVVEIRDLVFVRPFAVRRDETRSMNVKLSHGADHQFAVFGDCEDQPYATARVAYVDSPDAPRQSVSAIRERCHGRLEVVDKKLPQHFMDFGPRWANIHAIHLGQDEALIDLALPEAYVSDLTETPLHPAMLDMATGAAQRLISGFAERDDFYVPFSYGRVLVRRPLPSTLSSHVRLRSTEGRSAIFDVTLLDEEGNELVSIERYIMRRVDTFAAAAAMSQPTPATTRSAVRGSAEEFYLAEGMTTAEGLEALDRILAHEVSPQVIASTLDIELWLSRLDAGGGEAPGTKTATPTSSSAAIQPRGEGNSVAPRDPVERELAAMWQDMLGVQQVSIHDDFFELGGQSLIALRLFNRIRKQYGIELPLSVLFQAPTIAATAVHLRGPLTSAHQAPSAGGEALTQPPVEDGVIPATESSRSAEARPSQPGTVASPRSPRVSRHFQSLVQIAEGGDRPALFCVHGAGGNVLNFRDLSGGLHPDQPFYGLQARGIDGVRRPHGSIEAMAQAYLTEIREVQPHGPYLLAGYSGGGIVAFEMARQLAEVGEEVPLLVFFDTFYPRMQIRTVHLDRMLQRLRRERLGYLKEVASARIDRLRGVRERWRIERCLRRNSVVPFDLRDRQLTENFIQAVASYQPQPWPGRAVLFRAETVDYIFGGGSRCYGWDEVVLGGVETVGITGNHATLLLGANARELLGHLNAALDHACRRFA